MVEEDSESERYSREGYYRDAPGNDWLFWFMISFFVFSCVIIFLIILFEDPEVRAYSRQQARRMSEWYYAHDRHHHDEMIMLHRHQAPNPPLYQTIVPPTYSYQKPPTPIEPPPSYEQWPAPNAAERATDSNEAIGAEGVETETATRTAVGQPEYTRRGKVKKHRLSSLLSHVNNIEGQKLVMSGHSLYLRDTAPPKHIQQEPSPESEETLVYEFSTQQVGVKQNHSERGNSEESARQLAVQ